MFDVPLATANAIYNLANVVLIFGAVLVTVGTIAAIWSGGIRGRYADERISQNEINTARANEHAAFLEKEAEQARLETEQLRQQMAWRHVGETIPMTVKIGYCRSRFDGYLGNVG